MSRKSPNKSSSQGKLPEPAAAAKPVKPKKRIAKRPEVKQTSAKRSVSKATPGKRKTTSGAAAVASSAVPELTEGQPAPPFSSRKDNGTPVTLADYAGRKLVIFFYPRADTPGCTREAVDFTQLANAFASVQTDILGVSADDLKAQVKFRDKHQLGIPLIADVDRDMIEAFGVWGEKSMYGKTFLGILRTTVLIDRAGQIARIWRNVKVDGHAAEVLEAARAL